MVSGKQLRQITFCFPYEWSLLSKGVDTFDPLVKIFLEGIL